MNIIKSFYLKKLFIILSLCIYFTSCDSLTGVKLSVNQDLIKKVQSKFLPPILEKIKSIAVPDQSLSINIYVSTINFNITNINLNVQNFTQDKVTISFAESNKILLNVNQVLGNGTFNLEFILGQTTLEKDSIELVIKKLNLAAVLELTSQESKINPGKLLPSGQIASLILDFDFDFDIKGSWFASIASFFKDRIKNMIIDKLQATLKTEILDESKKIISDFIANQTVYVPIPIAEGMALDYSLVTAPIISNGNLVVNSNAAMVNRNKNFTMFFEQNSQEILQYENLNEEEKCVKLSLSSSVVDNAFKTLYDSNLLKFKVGSDFLPKNSSVQLNTTTLDVFINNLSKVYGKDKLIQNSCEVKNLPRFTLNKNLNLSVDLECVLSVESDNNTYSDAIKYISTAELSANIKVSPQGHVNANVNDITVRDSKILENKVDGAEIRYFEQMVEFLTDLGAPVANKKFLNNLNITIPLIQGIDLSDSEMSIEDGFINLGVTPLFSDTMVDKVLEFVDEMLKFKSRRVVKIEQVLKFLQN